MGRPCGDPSLTCTAFTTGDYCVQHCSGPNDCSDPLLVCQQNVCLARECGPHSTPANGTALLAACSAADAGDGWCVDLPLSDGAKGICERSGTLANGETCAYYTDGGPAALCSPGTTCFVSVSNGRTSRCATLCDATHGCAANQQCYVAVPPVDPPLLSAYTISINFGGCLDVCTVGEDGGCSPGFSCTASPAGGGVCDPD
jgi:hypothetical protein